MTRVWLASYPKSGNTWFRMLVAALSITEECPLDINALSEPSRMITARAVVEHATMIDTALLTRAEADVVRSRFYSSAIHLFDSRPSNAPTRFYKIHDAYVDTSEGGPVLGRDTASGAIVLVRDPRDVAISLAAHFNTSIDWAIDFMGRDSAALGARSDDRLPHFEQRLLTWAGHVGTWLNQRDIPVHVVRYESLLEDTVNVFLDAMVFAGRAVTRAEATRAVEEAAFEHLQAQERRRGFREGPRHGPFFRSGRAGGWREVLTSDQVQRIEEAQSPLMEQLGYETVVTAAARGRLEI